jgi:hypothetical protein
VGVWLQSDPSHAQHACHLAASFEWNDDWEFDPKDSVRRFSWSLASRVEASDMSQVATSV